MSNFLLLNGPNLNLLGKRETKIYGKETLKDIEDQLSKIAKEKGQNLESFQSNAEHDLVNKILVAEIHRDLRGEDKPSDHVPISLIL